MLYEYYLLCSLIRFCGQRDPALENDQKIRIGRPKFY